MLEKNKDSFGILETYLSKQRVSILDCSIHYFCFKRESLDLFLYIFELLTESYKSIKYKDANKKIKVRWFQTMGTKALSVL